jgi:phospholipid/cholesterol/gamma-HCH transport system substrate-binding protein
MRRIILGLLLMATLTGCGVNPPDLVPLPGRQGLSAGSYHITVQMANVANLVPNAEVKLDDVTVGTVTRIAPVNWHASLTVNLNPSTVLPANATAKIAQRSLLGAEYLELAPPKDEPPSGRLRGGDVIPLSRSDRYPETEEVLAALSTVLNGANLGQVKAITTELNAALGGREGDVRALVGTLGDLVGTLDGQRGNIVRTIDQLDRLSTRLNNQHEALGRALDALPGGLSVVNAQRTQLVAALGAVSDLGDVAIRVLDDGREDLRANLHSLAPALARLADAGPHLTGSLSEILTFPFPANTAFPSVIKGDYTNIFVTLDVSPDALARNFGLNLDKTTGVLSGPRPATLPRALSPVLPKATRPDAGPLGALLGGH